MIDALLMAVDIISTAAGVKEKMAKELQEKGYTVGDREYILVTGHVARTSEMVSCISAKRSKNWRLFTRRWTLSIPFI